jgi:protein tyrosine/serine phosphatase
MAIEPLERFLPLEGCFNFRDLGGYPTLDGRTVKWRKLFRSDNQFHLTNEDVDYVANTLGVVTVVDLRSPEEFQHEASRANTIPTAQYHNIPFLQGLASAGLVNTSQDPVERFASLYLGIVRAAGSQIASAVTALATGGSLPAVFHCRAGKDRTGILAALVLGTLGVSEQDIIEDYAITNQVIDQIIHRLSSAPGLEHLSSQPVAYFAAQPTAMERGFAEINGVYGGVVGYLQAQGVSESSIAQLQKELLD